MRRGTTMNQTFSRVVRLFKSRKFIALLLVALLSTSLLTFLVVPLLPQLPWGSPKVVIILGANKGGGVLERKGAKEWGLEKISIENKVEYANRHGYNLAIKDRTSKKRYTHEWRESWETIDIIKETMKQFPRAEWFWWMDLNTYIMEPQRSLDKAVFSKISEFDRNCSSYNPANFDLDLPYVDYSQPVNMIMTQDCSGFSMGSFFLRRSQWTDLLLDLVWDPVFYEQKHQEWIHSEQSALEYLYATQAWVRSSVALAPQRTFNSYPLGACGERSGDDRIFYQKRSRDFAINLAGCEWGRDCWNEITECQRTSDELHHKKFYFF